MSLTSFTIRLSYVLFLLGGGLLDAKATCTPSTPAFTCGGALNRFDTYGAGNCDINSRELADPCSNSFIVNGLNIKNSGPVPIKCTVSGQIAYNKAMIGGGLLVCTGSIEVGSNSSDTPLSLACAGGQYGTGTAWGKISNLTLPELYHNDDEKFSVTCVSSTGGVATKFIKWQPDPISLYHCP